MTSKQKVFIPSTALLIVLAAFASFAAEPETPHKKFFVPPPPFSPGIFPCSQCHSGMPVNKQARKLDMHQEITLNHMPGGWCFDCHNTANRDMLRLANGKLVPFSESYNLCGHIQN